MEPMISTPADYRQPHPDELEVFNKCILASINHRNDGKVAECCQTYFPRISSKKLTIPSEHLSLVGISEFRKKQKISCLNSFLRYLDLVKMRPRIGGEYCQARQAEQIKLQGQEILELKAKVGEHEQRIRTNEEENEFLKKRLEKLEEVENRRHRQLLDNSSFACHNCSYCLVCGHHRFPDDWEYLPIYEEFLRKKDFKFFSTLPVDVKIMAVIERKVANFKTTRRWMRIEEELEGELEELEGIKEKSEEISEEKPETNA
jgi:hypothetical protein